MHRALVGGTSAAGLHRSMARRPPLRGQDRSEPDAEWDLPGLVMGWISRPFLLISSFLVLCSSDGEVAFISYGDGCLISG